MSHNLTPKNDEPVRVNLENGKLTVQLKPPRAPRKKKVKISGWRLYLLIGFLCVSMIYVFALMRYISPYNVTEVQKIFPNIGVAYKAPRYLSVGDENTIEVLVINLNLNEPFTGVVTLKFDNSAVPVITSDKGVSILIDNLQPGGRLTRLIKIKLSKKPTEKTIYYYFQISLTNKNQTMSIYDAGKSYSRSQYDKFLIAPIGYLRSSLAWVISGIGGTGILGLLGNYLIDRFRKYLNW